AGAEASAQLALHSPLLAGGGPDDHPALVPVAVHGQHAGDVGRALQDVAPVRVGRHLRGDRLEHLGDLVVVGLGIDVQHHHGIGEAAGVVADADDLAVADRPQHTV